MITLRKHQKQALSDLREHDKFAVFMDCGGGKTVLTLERIKELLKSGKVTLITPKQLIKSVWIDEIEKFNYGFKTQVITKPQHAEKDADIYIHTPDYITSKNYCGVITPYLVVDEASKFKNYNSNRTKKITEIAKQYKKIILLTATPTPKGFVNLFSLIRILDGGERLSKYITHFRRRYYNQINEYLYVLKQHSENEIIQKIKDVARFYKIEGGSLKYINNIVNINMDKKYIDRYNHFLANYVYHTDNGKVISYTTGDFFVKLRQLSSGYIKDNDGENIEISKHKIERLMLMIDGMNEQSCLIFCNYNYEIELLSKSLTNYGIINGRTKNIEEVTRKWNNKEIQILIANPIVCGLGLNLQQGGHNIIWYSPTFDAEVYYQANRRLLRSGQEQTVMIHNLCTKGTVEKQAYAALENKQNVQDTILKKLNPLQQD